MARGRSSAPVTPVGPGKTAAPAAAAKSPAATSNRTPAVNRSPVPPENPAVAARPVADAALAPPLAPPPVEDVVGARDEDGSESENEAILSPESINASRRDAANAKRRIRGQLEDGLEGFDKFGVSFKLYDICKHKHFLYIYVLQVAELFLCAG